MHLFIAMSCHSIIIVVGLESVSFCCLELSWDNKVHFFIVKSCHGIIIVMELESAFFLLLGVVMGQQSSSFSF